MRLDEIVTRGRPTCGYFYGENKIRFAELLFRSEVCSELNDDDMQILHVSLVS
jgi:hypothetical protein